MAILNFVHNLLNRALSKMGRTVQHYSRAIYFLLTKQTIQKKINRQRITLLINSLSV